MSDNPPESLGPLSKQSVPHEQQFDAKIELIKINVDYVKRLTTLSTGSVLLITAFLEKLFTHPQWRAFIIISLLCFTASISAGVLTDSALVAASSSKRQFWRGQAMSVVGTLLLGSTLMGFLTGILALTIFAIKNILAL